MSIISIQYLGFLIIVLISYYAVKEKYRISVLFFASLVFIASFSFSFLFYALLFIAVNYLTGKKVHETAGKKRKYIYYAGQIFNIGGLAIYKYLQFVIENVNNVLGIVIPKVSLPYFDIIIPIGISYYTFQGISYLYLIYKANDKPETDFIHLGVYMLFFPKILAGPIERHRKFLPQLKESYGLKYANLAVGSRMFLWGALKKVVIADVLFVIIDSGTRNFSDLTGFKTLFVFLLLPVYMYADFSGYTDMARGVGRLFGLNLAINFNYPLFSKSISEFWRRWHISLSSWCNDFIFTRLIVKHRKWGNNAIIYGIFVTFLIVGLWHGATFNFILLGVLQAFAIIVEFLTMKQRKKFIKGKNEILIHLSSSLYVYIFFAISSAFFFLPDVSSVFNFLSGLFNNWTDLSLRGFDIDEGETTVAFAFVLILFVVELESFVKNKKIEELLPKKSFVRDVLYILGIVFLIYFSKYQNVFIYENF